MPGSRKDSPTDCALLFACPHTTSDPPLGINSWPTQDGVESESEAVTLGEDPYSDYSLSADDHIIMGYRAGGVLGARQGHGPPRQIAEQYTSFHGPPLEDVVGAASDLSDILPASVFDGIAADDPSDPYYF